MNITEQTEDTNKRLWSNESEETRNISQHDSEFNIQNYICFCDKAPGPSHYLRPGPHIRAEYCFENDKGTTTIKTSKKSDSAQKVINLNTVPTKNFVPPPNNFYYNIPKETPGMSIPFLGTKQKSIFSFIRPPPPARTSSVIIEELPNEPSNDTYANVRIKANETVANNTEVTNKSQMNDDKQVEVPNAKNLNKNSEQSGNSNQKCNKISPGKVKVADKYKNTTSKPEKYIPKV